MPLEIVVVPCLADNYAYLLREAASGAVALVDAPEAAPVRGELDRRGWRLSSILITHHHDDHVAGLENLRDDGVEVVGAAADAHRLPPLDRQVSDGESFDFAGAEVRVLDVSGHTMGHVAYHVPAARAAFTADSLMALGCGRVFEGTMECMWESLSKLAGLPDDTSICSGHEYALANARFALTVEPGNAALRTRAEGIEAARARGEASVPSILAEERATNPFLRASEPAVKERLGMAGAPDAEVFAEIRRRKDAF